VLKVLIVEDSIILADMLEDFLISQGYDVCGTASTVHEAVVLADLHNPDLAVLDFRLANNGYGSEIRPLLKNKIKMGILYVSGDPLAKVLTQADGDAYIHKPYGMSDLSQSLQIIHAIKTNGIVVPSLFPKSLHFFEEPFDDKEAA
jgi:DNA-binding response OmpR family regulator